MHSPEPTGFDFCLAPGHHPGSLTSALAAAPGFSARQLGNRSLRDCAPGHVCVSVSHSPVFLDAIANRGSEEFPAVSGPTYGRLASHSVISVLPTRQSLKSLWPAEDLTPAKCGMGTRFERRRLCRTRNSGSPFVGRPSLLKRPNGAIICPVHPFIRLRHLSTAPAQSSNVLWTSRRPPASSVSVLPWSIAMLSGSRFHISE